MRDYIIRRVLLSILVMLGAATIIFVLMHILPGNVALLILADQFGASAPEQLALLEAKLGLDKPLYIQYVSWLWQILHLDLGTSLWTGQPVIREIGLRAPISLSLALLAMALSVVLAVPIGMVCALRQDSWLDYGFRVILIAGISVPFFWMGILLILFLVSTFGWYTPLDYAAPHKDPLASLQQLIFPALVLGFRETALAARMMRSCTLEVIREDYVRTARSKGLAERIVIWIHVLKNAVLPVITVFGLNLVVTFGGLVIIERIFNIPGIGSFFIGAILRRDIPSVQGVVLIIAGFVAIINLMVDLIYAVIDPRIRYR